MAFSVFPSDCVDAHSASRCLCARSIAAPRRSRRQCPRRRGGARASGWSDTAAARRSAGPRAACPCSCACARTSSSEWPPRSKKLSSSEMRSTPNSSCQTAAITRSMLAGRRRRRRLRRAAVPAPRAARRGRAMPAAAARRSVAERSRPSRAAIACRMVDEIGGELPHVRRTSTARRLDGSGGSRSSSPIDTATVSG